MSLETDLFLDSLDKPETHIHDWAQTYRPCRALGEEHSPGQVREDLRSFLNAQIPDLYSQEILIQEDEE